LDIEVKLDEFVSWIKIDLSITPLITEVVRFEDGDDDTKELNTIIRIKDTGADSFAQSICFIANYDYLKEQDNEEYNEYVNIFDNTLRVGLYTHGRAGVYDEINYLDNNPDNQIKPTF
jgi:hypothetical protein